MPGSAPKISRQNRWLSTMTEPAPRSKSCGRNPRPRAGRSRSTSVTPTVTNIALVAIGASAPSRRRVTGSTSYWPRPSRVRAWAQSRASSAFTSGAWPRRRIDVPRRSSRSGSANGSAFRKTLLHHAADRRGGADAERHRQHDGERHHRRARGPSHRVAEVGPQLRQRYGARCRPCAGSGAGPRAAPPRRASAANTMPGPTGHRERRLAPGMFRRDRGGHRSGRRAVPRARSATGEDGWARGSSVSGSASHRRAPSCGRASWSNGAGRVRRRPSAGSTCAHARPGRDRATTA